MADELKEKKPDSGSGSSSVSAPKQAPAPTPKPQPQAQPKQTPVQKSGASSVPKTNTPTNKPASPKVDPVRQKIINQGFGPSKEQRAKSFNDLHNKLRTKYGTKAQHFDPYMEDDYDQPNNAFAFHTDGKGSRRSNYFEQNPDGTYKYSYRKGTHDGEEVIEDNLDDAGVEAKFDEIYKGMEEPDTSNLSIDYNEIERRKNETPEQSATRLQDDLKTQREELNKQNLANQGDAEDVQLPTDGERAKWKANDEEYGRQMKEKYGELPEGWENMDEIEIAQKSGLVSFSEQGANRLRNVSERLKSAGFDDVNFNKHHEGLDFANSNGEQFLILPDSTDSNVFALFDNNGNIVKSNINVDDKESLNSAIEAAEAYSSEQNERSKASQLFGTDLNKNERSVDDDLSDLDIDAQRWLNRGDKYDFKVERPSNDNFTYIKRKDLQTGKEERFNYDRNTGILTYLDGPGNTNIDYKNNPDAEYHSSEEIRKNLDNIGSQERSKASELFGTDLNKR